MVTSFTLPRWYDMHAHFRQGPAMDAYVQAHAAMGCAGILAMPNTQPPVSRVFETDLADGWSIQGYTEQLNAAGGAQFDHIVVPLYLTARTTPAMIEAGAKAGVLKAVKYYPPHGTTNADFGQPLQRYVDNEVLKALASYDVILCVHGEEHGLTGPAYFDNVTNAEDVFYKERLPRVLDKIPSLRVVCEHITTATAADFVRQSGDRIAATITPQHLLYTVGHLLQGLKQHLYCLPLVKFESDRSALRGAVTDPANTKFFAGTDSAPHTTKATACGCAAGCFTGGIAPQLYAQAFEEAGVDLTDKKGQDILIKFLSTLGPAYYGLKTGDKTFTMTREAKTVPVLNTAEGPVTPLPLGLGIDTLPWSLTL